MKSPSAQVALRSLNASTTELLEACVAPDGFTLTRQVVPVPGGDITLYGVEPTELVGATGVPAVMYVHGGAFYYALSPDAPGGLAYYAKNLGARVYMPDYRTSLDHPFPVPLQDCYAAATFLRDHSEALGIDSSKLLLFGDSAGGALVAGLTHYVRDHGGPVAQGQVLLYPVTDNSMRQASMQKYEDAPWPLDANRDMWDLYLRDGDHGQLSYAAPLQGDNFEDLPQAYIEPADIDILRDEGLEYAEKLRASGVPVEAYIVPGSYHAWDADQSNPLVKETMAKRVEVMRRMLGVWKTELMLGGGAPESV